MSLSSFFRQRDCFCVHVEPLMSTHLHNQPAVTNLCDSYSFVSTLALRARDENEEEDTTFCFQKGTT